MNIIFSVRPYSSEKDNLTRFIHTVKRAYASGIRYFRVNYKLLDQFNIDLMNTVVQIIRAEVPDSVIIVDLPFPYKKRRVKIYGVKEPWELKKHTLVHAFSEKEQNIQSEYPYIVIDADDLKNHQSENLIYADGEGSFSIVEKYSDGHLLLSANQNFIVSSNKSISGFGLAKSEISQSMLDKINKNNQDYAVDYIALSFISTKEDLVFCKQMLYSTTGFISKVETAAGVQQMDDIAKESEMVMMARGDLGLDVPINMLKTSCDIIAESTVKHNKKLLVATDVLSSLGSRAYPSRGDIMDLSYILENYNPFGLVMSGSIVNGDNYSVAIDIINSMSVENGKI